GQGKTLSLVLVKCSSSTKFTHTQMASSSSSSKKRKGKSAQTYNVAKFKSLFHADRYNKYTKFREVLAESRILIDTNELSPISEQINKRKWQRLTKPIQAVGYSLMR
ncbi:hypothetical protein PIB30_094466, partial [Stylosanthes scabra]|nr:hypothetical protein [Stylosanthes scabra]